MKKLSKDRSGQLLLVTGVMLAVLLLILATINVDTSNVLRTSTHQPDIGTNEMTDIPMNFERALKHMSEDYANSLPKKEAITDAFDDVCQQYNVFLSARNIIFKASRGPISLLSLIYHVDVTITLYYQAEGETSAVSQNLQIDIMI
jgi:hypothetical protein